MKSLNLAKVLTNFYSLNRETFALNKLLILIWQVQKVPTWRTEYILKTLLSNWSKISELKMKSTTVDHRQISLCQLGNCFENFGANLWMVTSSNYIHTNPGTNTKAFTILFSGFFSTVIYCISILIPIELKCFMCNSILSHFLTK